MPSPELIDERFAEIVKELRALPGAPDSLRERVREIAAPEPPVAQRWWSRFRIRNAGLTFATAAAALLVVAVGYGVITSGGGRGQSTASDELSVRQAARPASTEFNAGSSGGAPAISAQSGRAAVSPPPPPPPTTIGADTSDTQLRAAPVAASGRRNGGAVTLPAGRRLTQYTASMRLRVSDVGELSRTTREAMRIARSLGGFVAGVQYATPQGDEGDASLTLRVPVSKVQQAVVRLSNLGVILSQHISLQDVQDTVNYQSSEIARLRAQIRRIQARLERPISEDERFRLQLQLAQARESLEALTEQRGQTVRRARLAKITVALTTRERKVEPVVPGRIERSARNALYLLSNAAAGAIWVLILASPLILLVAAALVGGRARRRRFEQRLLEQA